MTRYLEPYKEQKGSYPRICSDRYYELNASHKWKNIITRYSLVLTTRATPTHIIPSIKYINWNITMEDGSLLPVCKNPFYVGNDIFTNGNTSNDLVEHYVLGEHTKWYCNVSKNSSPFYVTHCSSI